jgi:DNA repair protein RadC
VFPGLCLGGGAGTVGAAQITRGCPSRGLQGDNAGREGEVNMLAKRYRLKLATWTAVREPGQPSPHRLSEPEAVAALARDLLNANDDEKEHFWVLLLNTQNALTCAHHVSMGSLSASIVHPREVFRAAVRD